MGGEKQRSGRSSGADTAVQNAYRAVGQADSCFLLEIRQSARRPPMLRGQRARVAGAPPEYHGARIGRRGAGVAPDDIADEPFQMTQSHWKEKESKLLGIRCIACLRSTA